ncbi:MAG: hypothetical protein BM564_11855 [Bacteroidetes bacterium MedPE-SWsnd-G2]|nr:MAG: hypothetical protein BM564_11855 [Bacteroidetes bacterium MedPE-SWsnd-G2]
MLVLAFLLSPTISQSQTSLGRVKKEVKSSDKKRKSKTKKGNRSYSSSSGSSNSSILGAVIYYTTGFVFFGSRKHEEHLNNRRSPYAYFDNYSGNYVKNTGDDIPKKNGVILKVSDSFLYSDENLYANHLRAKIHPFNYAYLQFDYVEFVEKAPTGDEVENLSLFNFNFCYDRVRLDKFNLGWTLGATYIGNDVNLAGVSFGLNAEAFMVKNISIESAIKWSHINSEPVNQFEVLFKYYFKRGVVNLGYEHHVIASQEYSLLSTGLGVSF